MEPMLEQWLRSQGLEPDDWRVLPLLPLVFVAWADGTVQEAERALIERHAAALGVSADGMLHLRNWLHYAPSAALVRDGQAALSALCAAQGQRALLDDVLAFSKDVARAAGGLYGVGAISRQEAEAIDLIAAALGVDARRTWVRPNDATFIPADADLESDGPAIEVHVHTDHLAGASRRARLLVWGRLGDEVSAPVTAQGLTVGRADDRDVQISFDAQVSRRHCRLVENGGRYTVEDDGSTTGTWVNGQRIIARRLLGGEELAVGNVRLFFQLDDDAPR